MYPRQSPVLADPAAWRLHLAPRATGLAVVGRPLPPTVLRTVLPPHAVPRILASPRSRVAPDTYVLLRIRNWDGIRTRSPLRCTQLSTRTPSRRPVRRTPDSVTCSVASLASCALPPASTRRPGRAGSPYVLAQPCRRKAGCAPCPCMDEGEYSTEYMRTSTRRYGVHVPGYSYSLSPHALSKSKTSMLSEVSVSPRAYISLHSTEYTSPPTSNTEPWQYWYPYAHSHPPHRRSSVLHTAPPQPLEGGTPTVPRHPPHRCNRNERF